MPFVAFCSGLVWLIFSESGGSIASLFTFVRIGFEPCNNRYREAFVLPGPDICFCGTMLCFLSRLICLLILSLV